MIGRNDKISNLQMMILLINTIIGVGVLSIPSSVAMKLDTSGWVELLIGGLLVCIIIIIITKLMKMYPQKTIVEIGRELIGAPLTNIIIFVLVIYLLDTSAFLIRIFAEVIKMFLLLNTPPEVIIITMLLVTSYIARSGIESLARIAMIITPLVFIPLFILSLVLIQDLDFTNLLPQFRFGIMDLAKAIPTSLFSFGGFEFILIYMAFNEKPKEATKYNVLAIVVVTMIYILLFIICLARFGVIGLKDQTWPLLSLMKAVEFPGAFIENIEGVVISAWALVVFTALGPSLYVNSLIIGKVFRLKENNIFVLPLIPIVFVLSLISDNQIEVYEHIDSYTNYLLTFCAVIFPIALYIIALFKNKGGVQKDEQDA